jgi:hypothetical protein
MKRRQFIAGFAGTIAATLPPTLVAVADRVIE